MKKEESTFTLPNKTVTIKFIPRVIALAPDADKTHVAYGGMLIGSTKKFPAPLQKNGTIKNVLTTEEKDYIESVTGLNLSIYNGDFWAKFYVTLRKDDSSNKLDLSNPNDYISYKILQAYDKSYIAPSWSDRDKLTSYMFAITDDSEVTTVSNNVFNSKKEAYKEYGKIENKYETLLNVLRLLDNKTISDKTSISVVQNKVLNYVDSEPTKFLSVILDSSFPTKSLLHDAVNAGLIKKSGSRYITADGLELCEQGESAIFSNAIKYLDAPKNQEVRALIEAKLTKTKK